MFQIPDGFLASAQLDSLLPELCASISQGCAPDAINRSMAVAVLLRVQSYNHVHFVKIPEHITTATICADTPQGQIIANLRWRILDSAWQKPT